MVTILVYIYDLVDNVGYMDRDRAGAKTNNQINSPLTR